MRILFIYFNRYIRPRTLLSLSLLNTIIENEGHETKIFDTSFYKDFLDPSEALLVSSGIHKKPKGLNVDIKDWDPYIDFKKTIEEFDPHLVAFSYYTLDEDIHKKLLLPMRKDFPDLKVITGGPTPSINPRSCFGGGYVDWACCGEGENLLKEVCKRIEEGKGVDDIRGLWVINEEGTIVGNGVAPLTDLSTLPIQNWDAYDPIHILGLFEGRAYRMGHVEFTRGCPYDCTYCGSGSIKKSYSNAGIKKYVRHKTAEQFVDECEALTKKYNLEMFYFVNGTFTVMRKDVLRKLAPMYRDRVGLPFIALVHPNTIDEEVAELLNVMGCIHVSVGVESGDEEFRKKVFKRYMSNDRIIKSIHSLRKNNVHVSAYNILGVPGMDREHIFKTIELNRQAHPHSSLVSVLIPFLDAELTKNLIKDDLLREEDITIGTGLYPTVEIEDMTHDEIRGLFNTFNLYVKAPKILFPLIKLLENSNFIAVFIRKMLYKIIELERSYHLFKLRKRIKGGVTK